MDQWNVKEIMIEMTNLSIGYACIQPDAHHLCITIILGILARFHPGDRWDGEVNALHQQQKNSEGGFCQCLPFPLLLSFLLFFFSLHRKGLYREGNPLGLNHSNNTFTSPLSLSIPPFFHACFLVDQMQPIRN